jgi:uncharacterized membrane protein
MVSFNEMLNVLLVSALPISELRGGIPLALYYGFPPLQAYIICVIANALPIPFILLFLDSIGRILERWRVTSRIYRYLIGRTERKRDIIDRYGYPGLSIFVAIPLPITGAWTGSLLAFLLGMDRMKSFAYIFVGIMVAGAIVTLTSFGVISIVRIW